MGPYPCVHLCINVAGVRALERGPSNYDRYPERQAVPGARPDLIAFPHLEPKRDWESGTHEIVRARTPANVRNVLLATTHGVFECFALRDSSGQEEVR